MSLSLSAVKDELCSATIYLVNLEFVYFWTVHVDCLWQHGKVSIFWMRNDFPRN